jgi:sulfatase maturation enzyme AslB (radical SAM superfamily)
MQGPTGSDIRVLQVHPSLRCNLRCLHCYSESSPQEARELSLALLQDAISDARAEGYNVVGVSGGEPLLYSALPQLLAHARSLGMITSITTNGMLLTQQRIEQLHDVVNLIAISLDGVAESHNRMRAAPRAFEIMTRCLEPIRQAGIPFGFIFTLTLYNLDELEPVARFAVEQGATLLQVHPLEEVGRAKEHLINKAPDELELAYAFLEVARLQKLYADSLQIQFDVTDRGVVRQSPERVFALDPASLPDVTQQPLADLVSPLIIENSGHVVPIQYGFSHAYALGDLHQGRLSEFAAQWKASRYPAFSQLCRSVFDSLLENNQPQTPFANWYGRITQSSYADAPLSQALG